MMALYHTMAALCDRGIDPSQLDVILTNLNTTQYQLGIEPTPSCEHHKLFL